MKKSDTVVAVAGWEERYVLGMAQNIQTNRPSKVVVFVFTEYLKLTEANRAKVRTIAENLGVRYLEVFLPRQPVEAWRVLRDTFAEPAWWEGDILLDISTMPREIIYWSFSFLRSINNEIRYIYYQPEGYSPEWISRDSDRPRLVYQHSGISDFGKETCLLLISGFDTDRAAQLLQFFEPTRILIGTQTGAQFDNEEKNVAPIKTLLGGIRAVTEFRLDAYSGDHGFAAIANALTSHVGKYNLVAASLGPKPSAVALYRLHCAHPNIALVYTPSRQFNPDYSVGLGQSLTGSINFESCLIDPFAEVDQ